MIRGNLLIFPLLTGITLMATACFTVISDDYRRSNQGMNFVPQGPSEVADSPVSGSPVSERDSDTAYELAVIADPRDSAEFVVSPTPDIGGVYPAGTTVTIDVLLSPGWEIGQWIGPVYAISGGEAKISMERNHAVLVRMIKAD